MKLTKLCSMAVLAMLFAFTSVVQAQDANARFQAMADLGPGVQNTKLNEAGEMVSFLVIGTGRIRKSMPKQLALKQARQDAAREARNETAKFFNTSVKWGENAGSEMVCKMTGSASGEDEGTSQEESTFVETNSEASKAAAEAALSGLRKVWAGYDSNGTYVEVWGWQYATVKALVNASKAMGKAARETVNQAKAVEGARMQDPNAAYQKEEAKDRMARKQQAQPQAAPAGVAPAGYGGRNAAPVPASAAAADADDFF